MPARDPHRDLRLGARRGSGSAPRRASSRCCCWPRSSGSPRWGRRSCSWSAPRPLVVPGFIGLGNRDRDPRRRRLGLRPRAGRLVRHRRGRAERAHLHHFRVQSIVVTLGMGGSSAGRVDVWRAARIGTAPDWLTRFATVITEDGRRLRPAAHRPLARHRVIAAGRPAAHRGRPPRVPDRREPARGRARAGPDRARVVATFALSAVAAAVTGVLLTGFSGSGEPGSATPTCSPASRR